MALTRPRFGQLNTSVVAEADPITVLHQGATNANVDVGFLFNRANGLVANVALYWSESGNSIVAAFTSNSGTSDSNIAASGYANITIGSLLTVNGAAIAINGNTGTYGQVITSTGSGLIWADQLGIVSTMRASGNINAVGNVIAGNVTANTTVFAGNVVASSGFTMGSQVFYAQGTNGFSVNENFDPSNNSGQTAYHFASGATRANIAFTLARTGQFTDGFGVYGTSADNTFVTFGEQSNTSFEWRKGIGIQPLNLSGGTQLMKLSSAGNLVIPTATASASTTTGALVVQGGVGISGNLNIGGQSNFAGNVFAGNVLATGFFYANGTPFVSSSYGNVQMLANLASASATTIGNIYTTNGIYWANGAPYSTSTINPAVYFGKVTATTAPTLIDTLPVTGNNLVRWTTTSYDSVYNQYRSSTIDSVNNGTTVNYNEYSFIVSNVGTTVATFTSNITSGNINLWATGNTASVAVTFQRVVLGSGTTSGYLTAGPAGPAGATGATGTIANTASWIVTTNSTASTSTTTGALQVAGGAGIAGNLWTGGDISASNITATTYFVGNGSQLTGITMPWNIVSSNITMSKNNSYFVDTTTGPKMLTLPASNTLGDTIRINDLAGTFASNNLTVGANGGKIQGVAQDLLVSVNQKSFGLVYSNSTYGWKLLEL